VFKNLSIGVLALWLAACGVPRPRHAMPPNSGEPAATPNLPSQGRVYRIDESRSELRILVYRSGPLAHFGHNHVIVNRSIRGVVRLADAAGESGFSLSLPVAGFVVDDSRARREEGPDFAAEIPDDAKSGTLRNMRSPAMLDADEFPMITISGVGAAPEPDTPGAGIPNAGTRGVTLIVTAAISVAGHESTIEVPLTFESDSRHLSAIGSLELRQSVLGLTPYSLMMGALQVQDAMMIKFDIVADSS
jgi:hypothetical protein